MRGCDQICEKIMFVFYQGLLHIYVWYVRPSRRISVGSQYSYRSGSLSTNHKLMFCPDEDCSPAVEMSAFDDMFVSQFVVGRKRT